MISALRILIVLTISACIVLYTLNRMKLKKVGAAARIFFVVLCFCAAFLSSTIADQFTVQRTVTITALNQKASDAKEYTVYFEGFRLDDGTMITPPLSKGSWEIVNNRYSWFAADDDRRNASTTDSITFEIEVARKTEAVFYSNQWKGMASVETEGNETVVDTFYGGEGNIDTVVELPKPSAILQAKAVLIPAFIFVVSFLLLSFAAVIIVLASKRIYTLLIKRGENNRYIQKLQKYRFLFEELVKRDFVKKYKRTVLGMAWSVLSPMLTLLVMRLVFTQFFGRTTPHYTTYLFCGNLVYSYFNESTTQGMTSLMSNSGIFTKVNVPKYLFLLSKNVQTLINFGLTLCVFFLFCILDRVTFTWKFVMLLYPICSLVLFNIGVGLILSALFVFFKDIQYLWSIFTMLLMYMSAIFYTIDRYPAAAQNLFLLNPVYLHINYFRKIVIDSVIPSPLYHLLMVFDVAVVVGIGCWMYKKYNTKFLYYV